MAELKQMYRTVMDDHFPERMIIQLGNQILVYQKKSWKIPDDKTGELIEKGLRYGENPGQEAALYELTRGNLALGGCEFIGPGKGLVSAISEEEMLQSGKHPGKINFTDADNALNILKYLMDRPAAAIMKHNNPSGVAYGRTLVEAYDRANLADRIAAFGGCLAVNRPLDRATAEMVRENYLEVVVAPEYEEGTVDILKKRANLRIVRVPRIDRTSSARTAPSIISWTRTWRSTWTLLMFSARRRASTTSGSYQPSRSLIWAMAIASSIPLEISVSQSSASLRIRLPRGICCPRMPSAGIPRPS